MIRKTLTAILCAFVVWITAAAAAAATAAAAGDEAVWTAIDAAARAEVADKRIPSLAVAVVGRDGTLWSQTYGFEDADKKRLSTLDSIYRVGPMTEVLTHSLVLQFVQEGKLDLDRPVDTYLADFKPRNPFGGTITLRMLLAHTGGLVQEPPVGSRFDADPPDLAATVRSLNGTTLVAAPGTTIKHSNAGLAVAGRVLEVVSGQSYAQLVTTSVLQPLGMRRSALTHQIRPAVYAQMVPFDSTRFPAPSFDFGDLPAAGLYSSARDVAQWARMMLGSGTLKAPRPQDAADHSGSVLGMTRGALGGWPTLESAGGVYGFSSDLLFAADAQLAVVVLSALDDNPSAKRLAHFAMTAVAAARAAQPIPVWPRFSVCAAQARQWEGVFRHGKDSLLLRNVAGGLYLEAPEVAAEVRCAAGGAVLDDARTYSDAVQLSPDFNRVVLSGDAYERVDIREPSPPVAAVREILGDYGPAHDYIRVFERDGRAYARIEWSRYLQLTALGRDLWALPRAGGPYSLETIRFERDAKGGIRAANLNGIVFPRRDFGAESAAALRDSMRPIASLRTEALASKPPMDTGVKRPVDLVELTPQMPGVRLDVRYATTRDFLKTPVYSEARAFLQRPAVQALSRATASLAAQGFGLTIFDGYRPWFVTKMFWDATPDYNHVFVGNPAEGSRHNRGAAVDLTLHDLATGREAEMTGGYDEMSSRSYPLYVGGTSLQRWRRDLLRHAMEAQGFTVYEAEWWHFDFNGWQDYPISNLEFSQIGQ